MSHQLEVRLIQRWRPSTSAAGLNGVPAKEPSSPCRSSSTRQSPYEQVSATSSDMRNTRTFLYPRRSVVTKAQTAPAAQMHRSRFRRERLIPLELLREGAPASATGRDRDCNKTYQPVRSHLRAQRRATRPRAASTSGNTTGSPSRSACIGSWPLAQVPTPHEAGTGLPAGKQVGSRHRSAGGLDKVGCRVVRAAWAGLASKLRAVCPSISAACLTPPRSRSA